MELPHFNRTLTSIVSGSILTFTLILGYHNEIRNLFEFENNRIANFLIDDKKSNLILYPQSNYYSTPEKFVIKDYKLNIKIDPKADITYKIHSYFPEDFIKVVIFITLFAFIYIVGETITTLADLGLWWIFGNENIYNSVNSKNFIILIFTVISIPIFILFIFIKMSINTKFIKIPINIKFIIIMIAFFIILSMMLLVIPKLKDIYKPFINKACLDSNSFDTVEYILGSCKLTTDDFIRISNKTDNYFLQESERYFDYSLFFGSVGWWGVSTYSPPLSIKNRSSKRKTGK